MNPQLKETASSAVDRQRLVDLIIFEYRSLVVRRLGVTAEWRVLEWTDSATCSETGSSTPQTCGRCPVRAECLAAALASDDPAKWRGGLDRSDREHLWAGLERTYREVRDFELMRLDLTILRGNSHGPATASHDRPDRGNGTTPLWPRTDR